MNDKFEDLLDEYWEAAYSEGFDGRVNDTKDARAQRALAALCEYHEAILARVARLEGALRGTGVIKHQPGCNHFLPDGNCDCGALEEK